ncbi:MAG: MFS transporter [Gemmatimonas sp. SG8_38_2]|nr:MAG: MFS transporter [Gemmatimonas sp. SG8_38_2]
MTESASLRSVLRRKPIVAWALYDWANSAFATTVMAGFFPVFFSAISADISTGDSQFWFNVTLAAASILVAISAPLLGAIADRGGSRKKFLAFFASLGVVMTAALAWVQAGQWWMGLFLYGLGTVGFAGANVFYDSMLVDVAEEDELDLVSALGYSAGYIGGGLLFAVNVLMVQQPEWFGFSGVEEAVKASFLSVGLWWAVFTIPLLVSVREMPTKDRAPRLQAIRAGLRQLADTLKEIRSFKVLTLFLVAYWIYIDGVNTVIKTAVFFGDRVLGLEQAALITALLLTQFVAFPAALGFGALGARIGPKPAIMIGLGVYLAALVYAWRFLQDSADFYVLAVAIGLVQGGVQSLSRSLYARLIPSSKTAEFFGFFNMVGKFASIFGPLLIAVTPKWIPGASERDGILSLTLLFVLGGFLLSRVRVAAGVDAARRFDA